MSDEMPEASHKKHPITHGSWKRAQAYLESITTDQGLPKGTGDAIIQREWDAIGNATDQTVKGRAKAFWAQVHAEGQMMIDAGASPIQLAGLIALMAANQDSIIAVLQTGVKG